MSGICDGTSRMVLVEEASKSGVSTSNFKSFYQLAAYAIRMGAINDEDNCHLEDFIKNQNLDGFVDIHPSLDCDSLLSADDQRNDIESNL